MVGEAEALELVSQLELPEKSLGGPMNIEPRLLDLSDIATLGGAVMAVLAVTNTLAYALNLKARWLGLLVALVVSSLGSLANDAALDLKTWLLALLNACVIYSASAGLNEIGYQAATTLKEGKARAEENDGRRRFWLRWF